MDIGLILAGGVFVMALLGPMLLFMYDARKEEKSKPDPDITPFKPEWQREQLGIFLIVGVLFLIIAIVS